MHLAEQNKLETIKDKYPNEFYKNISTIKKHQEGNQE